MHTQAVAVIWIVIVVKRTIATTVTFIITIFGSLTKKYAGMGGDGSNYEKWLTPCIVYKNSNGGGVNFNSDNPSCLFEIVSMLYATLCHCGHWDPRLWPPLKFDKQRCGRIQWQEIITNKRNLSITGRLHIVSVIGTPYFLVWYEMVISIEFLTSFTKVWLTVLTTFTFRTCHWWW